MWGPVEPMMSTVKAKADWEIQDWIAALQRKVVMATERGNGDGFWEARVDWYSRRKSWLEKILKDQTTALPVKKRWREEAKEVTPMKVPRIGDDYSSRPRMNRGELQSVVGGWPSAHVETDNGPMPSGLPTGERKDTSSLQENPSPSPSLTTSASVD